VLRQTGRFAPENQAIRGTEGGCIDGILSLGHKKIEIMSTEFLTITGDIIEKLKINTEQGTHGSTHCVRMKDIRRWSDDSKVAKVEGEHTPDYRTEITRITWIDEDYMFIIAYPRIILVEDPDHVTYIFW
jgi:hypothetical protein